MKKIIVIIASLFLLTGCVAVQDMGTSDIVDETLKTKYNKIYNHVGIGYKYYLPKSLITKTTDNYNEVIKSKKYDYYLYVDLISYHNNVDLGYKEKTGVYYSRLIEKNGKKGIINVYQNGKDELLTKVEFNYASIEVVSKKEDLNEVLANCIIILTSVDYNDSIIEKLLEEGLIANIEETVDIFESTDNGNYLEVDDTYKEDDEATNYDNVWVK